jgi:hypothetical protein
MKSPQSEASSSPRVHSANIQRELSQLIDHLDADIHRVNDPRFRGLLDKSAEVLRDLRSLFQHFDSTAAESRGGESAPSGRSGKDTGRKAAGAARSEAGKKTSAPRPGKKAAGPRANRKKNATTAAGPADKAGNSPQEMR